MLKSGEIVTAVIKAKNEGDQIALAIESAFLLADRVLVIDDRSSDGTEAIARAAGADVVVGLDHGGQIDRLDKQGFALIDRGWILRMDADERLTDGLASELRQIAESGRYVAAQYARLNHMFGAPVRHGGWFDAHQRGFFRFDAWSDTWSAEMHTQVPVVGPIAHIPNGRAWMVHLDYESISQFIHRSLLGYAQAEAREMQAAGTRFSARRLLLDPWKRTWGRYYVRRGYRDGMRGLVLAALLGSYDIARWSFLWELEKSNKQGL